MEARRLTKLPRTWTSVSDQFLFYLLFKVPNLRKDFATLNPFEVLPPPPPPWRCVSNGPMVHLGCLLFGCSSWFWHGSSCVRNNSLMGARRICLFAICRGKEFPLLRIQGIILLQVGRLMIATAQWHYRAYQGPSIIMWTSCSRKGTIVFLLEFQAKNLVVGICVSCSTKFCLLGHGQGFKERGCSSINS